MQDSEIKLAQCARCSAYVWVCDVSGGRVAVDPLPLGDYTHVMVMLSLGRSIYDVIFLVKGKPSKLRWLGGPGTIWEPNGRTLVAAHGCGAHAGSAVVVEMPPENPQQAPATPGRPSGGFPHAPAPVSGSQGRTAARSKVAYSAPSPSRATHATHRPFKCDTCGKLIHDDEPYVAIEHYRYVWAQHDYDCTAPEKWSDEAFEQYWNAIHLVGYDTANVLNKKGLLKPIETVELPE